MGPITIHVNRNKPGQIQSIDETYSLVTTPYVYFSEDDMYLMQRGLLQENIRKLEGDPKLLMVWNNIDFHSD